MSEAVGYLAAVCIGVILGLLGGGGSILSIPILVYLFSIDAVTASAYSLFIVGVTSLVGAIPKYRDHLVDVKTGIIFGIPSLLTIFSTRKWIVPAIPDVLLHTNTFTLSKRAFLLGLFAILMILASYSMIREKQIERDEGKGSALLMVFEGIVIGLLTGLVGAGGGFLIIPALVLLTGLQFKTAVGTSLFIIAINSLTGFIGDALNYHMDWAFLLEITSLAVIGIFLGNKFQRKISAVRLRKGFGWFILGMGLYIITRELIFK